MVARARLLIQIRPPALRSLIPCRSIYLGAHIIAIHMDVMYVVTAAAPVVLFAHSCPSASYGPIRTRWSGTLFKYYTVYPAPHVYLQYVTYTYVRYL